MATTLQHTSCSSSDDWQDPVNWELVLGRFGRIQNLQPRLPQCTLQEVAPPEELQGRREAWDDIGQRYRDHARSEVGYKGADPYRSIACETRLILGVLALPRQLVLGTYKRLFGEISEMPSTWELFAVAFALFDPPRLFWGKESWMDVCRRAELMQARRDAITAQVQELLELGR
ncbi:hypothetical protein KBZ14_05960 [Synechococcus sp. HJ21-Hayes]|uniref:hypothetical protein n=1 Tax=unclassified Synechococcus TaxID=2626047 RepID=UPI0020CCAD8F|nr:MULTISPECIES: hypothetical protein [unclassified Synechococcus]MCP9831851.1 hypothetical protein [Synechococcus sp. JJ3a-Johnson]MCP9852414.1 hypothetical protein [Synechococcus sp. HJ21-Hayes]